MAVAAIVDLRSLFGPARDQGQRPTCMAFAASDAHAAARGPFEPLSVEFAHYHGVRRKAVFDPASGVPLLLMAAAIEQDGQPLEAGWQYQPTLPSDLCVWQPPADPGPVFRRASAVGSSGIDEVLTHLDGGRPVVIVVKISVAFHYAIPGVPIIGSHQDPDAGIHAMVAVGHGTAGSNRLILLRNSWGAAWCDNGHAWVEEQYLAGRLLGISIMSQGSNTP